MSKQTLSWLNNFTLIGFTEKRGNAWTYRADLQGDEPNHYVGAIPVEDVIRRLFHWTPVVGSISNTYVTEDGVTTIVDETRKSILRPVGAFGPDDKGYALSYFKLGYEIHEFPQWLLTNFSHILNGTDLAIGSAGLLKEGGVAWVQIETPEVIKTAEGFDFSPFHTACTSLDGSLSSTYFNGVQAVVCDNTLSAGIFGASSIFRIKHSAKSLERITDVQDALGIIHNTAEVFQDQLTTLCQIEVSDKAWSDFLDAHIELPEKAGRGRTLAENKRDAHNTLWNNDLRVAPWKNTAFGVVQTVNTFAHHVQNVRGTTRPERNALRAATGGVNKLDADTFATLQKVLSRV